MRHHDWLARESGDDYNMTGPALGLPPDHRIWTGNSTIWSCQACSHRLLSLTAPESWDLPDGPFASYVLYVARPGVPKRPHRFASDLPADCQAVCQAVRDLATAEAVLSS